MKVLGPGYEDTSGALVPSNCGVRLPGAALALLSPKRGGGGHIAIFAGRDQSVDIESSPAERPLSFRWRTHASQVRV
jgi:hypothetical protein